MSDTKEKLELKKWLGLRLMYFLPVNEISLHKISIGISGLFLISGFALLLRWPLLDRPLSKHHEFCTAMVMRVWAGWQQNAPQDHKWLPIMNYGLPQDKWINNFASSTGKMVTPEGNYFYVSHPPLGYLLPWASLRASGFSPTVKNLQLWHFFIAVFCGLVALFIARILISKDLSVGFAVFAFYQLNPVVLWFQGNVYMSDMMVMPFFMLAILFSAVLSKQKKMIIPLAGVGFAIFLAAFITWFGYLLGLSWIIWWAFQKTIRSSQFWTGSIFIISCLALSFGLTCYWMGAISGLDNLFQEWLSRFQTRTEFSNLFSNLISVLKNYATGYAAGFLLIVALLFLLRKKFEEWRRTISFKGSLISILCLSFGSVALLHLLLSNYSGHDFTTLYAALPLSLLFGKTFDLCKKEKRERAAMALLFIGLVAMAGQFWYINRPGEVSLRGERYDRFRQIADQIKARTTENEALFLAGQPPFPEFIWELGRNIKRIESKEEICTHLAVVGQFPALWIHWQPNDSLVFEQVVCE